MTRTLVISAVNFTEGGPLTVLHDAVHAARETLPGWRIVVMAHDASLITTAGVEVRAFPATKTSWLQRLKLEWHGFMRESRALQPDVWLSLHDITPRVVARHQAVYCHNPAAFHRIGWREAFLEPKFLLFNLFYGRLYGMFIHRNRQVIVQQQWLRRRRYIPHFPASSSESGEKASSVKRMVPPTALIAASSLLIPPVTSSEATL